MVHLPEEVAALSLCAAEMFASRMYNSNLSSHNCRSAEAENFGGGRTLIRTGAVGAVDAAAVGG